MGFTNVKSGSIKRLPVQNPLDAPLGLGTQPCFEALSELLVKIQI